jgi:hypothetical protein
MTDDNTRSYIKGELAPVLKSVKNAGSKSDLFLPTIKIKHLGFSTKYLNITAEQLEQIEGILTGELKTDYRTLKERILEAFPEAEFSNHESDLYVLNTPGLRSWLKLNYEFYCNVQSFIGAKGSDWEGRPALDIPFAYDKDRDR